MLYNVSLHIIPIPVGDIIPSSLSAERLTPEIAGSRTPCGDCISPRGQPNRRWPDSAAGNEPDRQPRSLRKVDVATKPRPDGIRSRLLQAGKKIYHRISYISRNISREMQDEKYVGVHRHQVNNKNYHINALVNFRT